MGAIGITLLMLLGIAGFGALAWRKLAIVQALAPVDRFGDVPARLRSVLHNGLLQQRMLAREWKPGLMHAVIFLGFLALLLRKLNLLAIGFVESATFPDAFGGPFAAFKDIVELAVTAAGSPAAGSHSGALRCRKRTSAAVASPSARPIAAWIGSISQAKVDIGSPAMPEAPVCSTTPSAPSCRATSAAIIAAIA